MKNMVFAALLIAMIWGCASSNTGENETQNLSLLAQHLVGVWVRPEPGSLVGVILFADGGCSYWTSDFQVFQGHWTLVEAEGRDPEVHFDMGGIGDEVYSIPRYNDLSLQLVGPGSLGVILRKGTKSTLKGSVRVEGKIPKDATLVVELNRFGRLENNERLMERELIDRYEAPWRGGSGDYALNYIEDFISYAGYELKAWVADAEGDTLAILEEPQALNLRVPEDAVDLIIPMADR